MSLVTGYLKQIAGVAANDVVTIRAAVAGVITASGALISPGTLTVRARATDGFWSATLTKGTYEISATAANGQSAKVTITIPDEDELTYAFEELVVSSLPLLEEPVGGARPTASPSVLGLVKTDDAVAVPIACTGWFYKLSIADLEAVPNQANNKVGFVQVPNKVFGWNEGSLAAADGSTVLIPDDTGAGEPGRWIDLEILGGGGGGGGGSGELQVVDDMAALRALASGPEIKMVFVDVPDAGGRNLFLFRFGDASAADGVNVIAPDDGGGRYHAKSIF